MYADELDEPELEVVVKPNRPSPIRLLWRGGSGVGEVGGRVVVGLFKDAAVFCFFLAGVFGIMTDLLTCSRLRRLPVLLPLRARVRAAHV